MVLRALCEQSKQHTPMQIYSTLHATMKASSTTAINATMVSKELKYSENLLAQTPLKTNNLFAQTVLSVPSCLLPLFITLLAQIP